MNEKELRRRLQSALRSIAACRREAYNAQNPRLGRRRPFDAVPWSVVELELGVLGIHLPPDAAPHEQPSKE